MQPGSSGYLPLNQMIMITISEVYRKIRELSADGWNPRPVISVNDISEQLRAGRDYLMPLLMELSAHKLIRFDDTARQTIRLTLLGNNVR